MEQLKIGDIVILKSTSLTMTVESFTEDGRINCQSFIDSELCQITTSAEVLEFLYH